MSHGQDFLREHTVDSKKLGYGPGAIYAVFFSSFVLGVGGQSYSNLLASTVGLTQHLYQGLQGST